MKWGLFLVMMLCIGIVGAELQVGYNSGVPKVELNSPAAPTNYSSLNVTDATCWQGVCTAPQSTFLNLSGTNAIQDIDLGAWSLKATETNANFFYNYLHTIAMANFNTGTNTWEFHGDGADLTNIVYAEGDPLFNGWYNAGNPTLTTLIVNGIHTNSWMDILGLDTIASYISGSGLVNFENNNITTTGIITARNLCYSNGTGCNSSVINNNTNLAWTNQSNIFNNNQMFNGTYFGGSIVSGYVIVTGGTSASKGSPAGFYYISGWLNGEHRYIRSDGQFILFDIEGAAWYIYSYDVSIGWYGGNYANPDPIGTYTAFLGDAGGSPVAVGGNNGASIIKADGVEVGNNGLVCQKNASISGDVAIGGNLNIGQNLSFKRPYWTGYDNSTQSFLNTANAQVINISNNLDYDAYGIKVVASQNLTFESTGDYICFLSPEFYQNGGGSLVTFWMQKNGVDVPWSNSRYSMSNNEYHAPTITYQFDIETPATDDIRFMWWSDSTNTQIYSSGALTSPTRPSIPGVLLNCQKASALTP